MRFITQSPYTRNFSSDLFSQMENLLSDFGTRPTSSFNPSVYSEEEENYYRMSVDAPGLKREDLKIELEDKVLTISGERKRDTQNFSSFKRSFHLPMDVDAEKIEAVYEDGVLELYLPKAESAKVRRVEVKANKDGFFSQLLNSKKSPEANPHPTKQ